MDNKSYEEYLKIKESELSREYRERYKVKWPKKPDNIDVDEELYNAIARKVSSGK